MIWGRFNHQEKPVYGIVEDERVTLVEGDPFRGYKPTDKVLAVDELELLVPVLPGTFYCAGANYLNHIIGMRRQTGADPTPPSAPHIGYRANSALIPHGAPIVKPKDATDAFQYEGELVAVFGKRARHVSKAEALNCVMGWTIGNDVSERTWQRADGALWRAKNSDTFKPMGPYIVTDPDFSDMETIIRIDGTEVERFPTLNMIFDAATFISETSRYVTFHPGDVMWLGTDGVPQNIRPGNVVEVEITGIGTLSNPVVAED
jgi:2-keto-4-pentenoate hydratase/2-oxohepta-3-ene-1,7-dioic acid hydratase in catechol pathway